MPDTPAPTDPTAEGSILVPGTGSVAVSPDVADLRLGVSISRPTVDPARAQAAPALNARESWLTAAWLLVFAIDGPERP